MLSGFQGNAGLFTLENTLLADNRVGAGMIGAAFALRNVTWSGNADDAVADNETAVFADASSAPRSYSVDVAYRAYGPVRNVSVLPLAASAQLPFLSGTDTSFGALQQVRDYAPKPRQFLLFYDRELAGRTLHSWNLCSRL